jgi:patatin-related protein
VPNVIELAIQSTKLAPWVSGLRSDAPGTEVAPMADDEVATEREAAPVEVSYCEYEREVRFAVVLYGGVSLAIYINGIVQELLHLVRATAPSVPTSAMEAATTALVDRPQGTERVYRRLGQFLTLRGVDRSAPMDRDHSGPIRTRFVVDILSGSSAGGINGVALAKALATGASDMDRIKRLWICKGDIGLLVNDAASAASIRGLPPQDPPLSLLNGELMAFELLEAFHAMDALETAEAAGTESCLVDELDCWVTATDLYGLMLPIRLDGEVVQEPRFKNVFRLLYRSSHASGDGTMSTDFSRRDNPFMAFAARCSSSFPFAFEPMQLDAIKPIMLMSQFGGAYNGDPADIGVRFERFYRDYKGIGDVPFAERSFGDGGILDNRPFTWATSTLTRRRADVPVDRHLIYLEPAPDAARAVSPVPPHALKVVAESVALPREDSIRDDIARLRARNEALEWMSKGLEVIDLVAPNRLPVLPNWATATLKELVDARGLQWAAYHELHIADVLEDLSELIARLFNVDAAAEAQAAVRVLIETWFGLVYETFTATDGRPTQSSFLLHYDLGYRLRRVAFLDDRIDHLLSAPDDALAAALGTQAPLGAVDAWDFDFRAALRTLKPELNNVLIDLRRAGRVLRSTPGTDTVSQSAIPVETVDAVRTTLGITSAVALAEAVFAGTRTSTEAEAKAAALLKNDAALASLSNLARAVDTALSAPLQAAAARLAEALTPSAGASPGEVLAKSAMRVYRDAYEDYDAVILPFVHSGVGEAGRVQIMRVSPASARILVDEKDRGDKLAGVQFGHFGGFFAERWRRNDMMWGRLDGAERLIEGLVPTATGDNDREALVAAIVKEAQIAILEDEKAGEFLGWPERGADLWDRIHRSWTVDLTLDQGAVRGDARRGLAVTRHLLQGIAAGAPSGTPPSVPAKVALGLAARATALVGASTPRTISVALTVALTVALMVAVAAGIVVWSGVWVAVLAMALMTFVVLIILLLFIRGKVYEALEPRRRTRL